MRNFLLIIIYFIVTTLTISSCKKESFYEGKDATLRFSMDTVSFDTVFSTIGTTTKRLMVYNPYYKKINISSIAIAGSNSPFVININGQNTFKINDIEISPNDSLYIFVQVYVNTIGQNLPMVLTDSLICKVNGNTQNIKLIAFGQDVHLIKNQTIKTQVWEADKPYLLFGNITVDSLQTLTITPGVKIYMHKNANIIIKGNIRAIGSWEEPIVFNQDRFGEFNDMPGYWGGISIIPGKGQQLLDWVIIENGISGLQVNNSKHIENTSVVLTNVIIRNMSSTCLLSNNSSVYASNCLFANAKTYTCLLEGGGTFQFYHSTLANYYSSIPNEYRKPNFPVLFISNYLKKNDDPNANDFYDIRNSFFRNCIIYGSQNNELFLDIKYGAQSDIVFDHCIIKKTNTNDFSTYFNSVLWNIDPKFINGEYLNFELDSLSSAKDAGDLEWGLKFPYDLKNVSRLNDNAPDIGAYERIEK